MDPLSLAMVAALAATCVMAFLRGDTPSRLTACILAGAFVISFSPVWLSLFVSDMRVLLSSSAGVTLDLLTLGLLVFVALAYRPNWTLFTAGFQLLSVMINVIRVMNPRLSDLVFATVSNMIWWMMLAALIYGVWQARRHQVRTENASPDDLGGVRLS